MGFRSVGASESESDVSEQSNTVYFVKGYDSAVTATVTDSEDDLFFLSGKSFLKISNWEYQKVKQVQLGIHADVSG